MKKNQILLLPLVLPSTAMAYAGPIDRFHDMLYCMMDGIWLSTITCGILYTYHLLSRSLLKWPGQVYKWLFIILWTTLLISLFDSWPLYLGELTAPIYLWVFFRVIRDRRVYPEEKSKPWYIRCWKWLYRCCIVRALIFTIPFLLLFSLIRYAMIKVGELSQVCVHGSRQSLYRFCRDTIFDNYSIDIHFISGAVLLFSVICLILEINKIYKYQIKESRK